MRQRLIERRERCSLRLLKNGHVLFGAGLKLMLHACSWCSNEDISIIPNAASRPRLLNAARSTDVDSEYPASVGVDSECQQFASGFFGICMYGERYLWLNPCIVRMCYEVNRLLRSRLSQR